MYEIIVSTLALALSTATAWLTLFRRGRVQMTRPTMIVLCQDGDYPPVHKIVIRSLLYCTADRGRVVETMYGVLRQGAESTAFAFWSYGISQLERGGGLFVGREGVAINHHFVLLSKSDPFKFAEGEYVVEVFATMVGDKNPYKLAESSITLTGEMTGLLNGKTGGVMFNWNPATTSYSPELQAAKVDLLISPESLRRFG
jgi:hypothetical protein